MGEKAVTVELTLDFEADVTKHAVAFPGAGEPGMGFSCVRVDGLDVWWRQRLVLAARDPKLSREIRPRRLTRRAGRAGPVGRGRIRVTDRREPLTNGRQYESLRI